MNTVILSTGFLLTVLSIIGLFFFIKASVRERTQQLQLMVKQHPDSLLASLLTYFENRAYRMTKAEENQLTFVGLVGPSWFMAIFLTCLAAVGCLCLGLTISMLIPVNRELCLGLAALAPVAGVFYWQRATRYEQVSIKLDKVMVEGDRTESIITVVGHRDELSHLRATLNF